jgi:hypothetical protein
MCKDEKKYKSIPLSEVKVGDEVFDILFDEWLTVKDTHKMGEYPIQIDVGRSFGRSYTSDGKWLTGHKKPCVTEARREVKTVTKEKWGLIGHTSIELFSTTRDSYEEMKQWAYEQGILPVVKICRITWEEKE